MTEYAILQIVLFLLVLLLLIKPLGLYMARVYEGQSCGLSIILRPVEKIIYKICHIVPTQEMGWKNYLFSMLFFNMLSLFFVYGIQRLQVYLPLNPQHFANVPPDIAFNTAASYVTNTNWQAYAGESTLSYFTQMSALTVQNFLSAATGMALLIAFIRGLVRHEMSGLGNFWVDCVRSVLYILLPLAFIFAIFLSSQGVIQNFKPYQKAALTEVVHAESKTITQQILPMGPVASQVAIKQLGTNGGGFFNANSAHPFENPTPVSNFFEMLAIILIPAALCYTFGVMVGDKRQGWAIFLAMFLIFVPMLCLGVWVESVSGSMEGKEVRLGIVSSAMWAVTTTATSNGSVNAMLGSFAPLAGMIPMWLMHLGEVVFGGVGSGLYGMLILVVIAVFIAGLMVGRTPEYLGKKIEPFEMKMASFGVLLMPLIVLVLTAVAVVTKAGVSAITDQGAHGLSEILYAFTSMGNNNGSAFAGIKSSQPCYTILGGLEMLIMRFWIAIPVLAIAGSLVRKKFIPCTSGTLSTHTGLFIIFLIIITFLLGALTFLPALALGPIVEHLMMRGVHG